MKKQLTCSGQTPAKLNSRGVIPTSKQRRFPGNRLRPGTCQDRQWYPQISATVERNHVGHQRSLNHQTGPATKTNVDEIDAWFLHVPCQSCYPALMLKRHFKGSFCIGSQLVLAPHQFHLVAQDLTPRSLDPEGNVASKMASPRLVHHGWMDHHASSWSTMVHHGPWCFNAKAA